MSKDNHRKETIEAAYQSYRDVAFNVNSDLQFWPSFLNHSIKEYTKKENEPRKIYSAIYAVNLIDPIAKNDSIWCDSGETNLITSDLQEQAKVFFRWVINLSILKLYVASEITTTDNMDSVL